MAGVLGDRAVVAIVEMSNTRITTDQDELACRNARTELLEQPKETLFSSSTYSGAITSQPCRIEEGVTSPANWLSSKAAVFKKWTGLSDRAPG